MPFELPLADAAPTIVERVDAARNRERILKVAAQLIEQRGIDHVSMQDIAREACVGAGTLYRRFGDRAGLALALLDDDTRAFQNALLRGPAPLGPGAPAAERLRAFGHGYLDHLDAHSSLMLAGEPSGRDGRGPFSFFLTHVTVLLREACPGLDAEHTAHLLLAGLSPREHLLLRVELGWPLERLHDAWDRLVTTLLAASAVPV